MMSLPAPPAEDTPSYAPLSGSGETGKGAALGAEDTMGSLQCSHRACILKEEDQLLLCFIRDRRS